MLIILSGQPRLREGCLSTVTQLVRSVCLLTQRGREVQHMFCSVIFLISRTDCPETNGAPPPQALGWEIKQGTLRWLGLRTSPKTCCGAQYREQGLKS